MVLALAMMWSSSYWLELCELRFREVPCFRYWKMLIIASIEYITIIPKIKQQHK